MRSQGVRNKGLGRVESGGSVHMYFLPLLVHCPRTATCLPSRQNDTGNATKCTAEPIANVFEELNAIYYHDGQRYLFYVLPFPAKDGTYGVEGNKTAEVCSPHAKPGMVDVTRKCTKPIHSLKFIRQKAAS